jgi:hypothetical protein
MRGAQPATSAGARLFAGSPIPALLPSSMGRHRDQKTQIVISSAQVSNAHFVCNEHSSTERGLWAFMPIKLGALAVAIFMRRSLLMKLRLFASESGKDWF